MTNLAKTLGIPNGDHATVGAIDPVTCASSFPTSPPLTHLYFRYLVKIPAEALVEGERRPLYDPLLAGILFQVRQDPTRDKSLEPLPLYTAAPLASVPQNYGLVAGPGGTFAPAGPEVPLEQMLATLRAAGMAFPSAPTAFFQINAGGFQAPQPQGMTSAPSAHVPSVDAADQPPTGQASQQEPSVSDPDA